MSLPVGLIAKDGRFLGNGLLWRGYILTAAHVGQKTFGESVTITDGSNFVACFRSVVDIDHALDLMISRIEIPSSFNLLPCEIMRLSKNTEYNIITKSIRPISQSNFNTVTQQGKVHHVRVPVQEGGGGAWLCSTQAFLGDSGSIVQCAYSGKLVGIVLGNPGFRPQSSIISPLYPWLSLIMKRKTI